MSKGALRTRPYDGSVQPFTIGMRPLDPARWIEPDDELLRDLGEKDAHFAERRDVVFRQLPGSEAAQAEALGLLNGHLLACHAPLYVAQAGGLCIAGVRHVSPTADEPPLLTAARLVQDDLCLLRRHEDGWRLVAGALCFPSTWSLAEKMGRPMLAIHEGVPDFAGPMATRVARIFDMLKPEAPVERFNWSIYGDGALHHPETHVAPEERFPPGCDLMERAHVRIERQTLTKLPQTGAILFTIRVTVDPFVAFAQHPDGARLAGALRTQLLELTEEQLAYKGLLQHRAVLAETLELLSHAHQR